MDIGVYAGLIVVLKNSSEEASEVFAIAKHDA